MHDAATDDLGDGLVGEMFLERGFEFTHEAVRSWETRFAPMISDALRRHRRGSLGVSWVVDETTVKLLHSGSRSVVLLVPGD